MNTKENPDFNSPHGHRQRLRDRYDNAGIDSLADYEVIEFLLMLCIPRIDVKPLAKELIARYKNLRGILDASASELLEFSGIGNNTALQIKFIKDCIETYHKNELQESDTLLDTIDKLIKFFKVRISPLKTEVLDMICLDTQLKLIKNGVVRIAEGNVSSAIVDIRKIIEVAMDKKASNIVLAHNHPSGNARPSLDDIKLTKKLSEACRPINLNLIEHIIIGKNNHYSFRRDGEFDVLYDESLMENRLANRRKVV